MGAALAGVARKGSLKRDVLQTSCGEAGSHVRVGGESIPGRREAAAEALNGS